MEWVVRFIGVWILFFLLVDWKEFKRNVWCGVFSICFQLAIDTLYIGNNYYKIQEPIISVMGSSLFFILGPVFIVAVLFAQFHPHKRWLQVIYVLMFWGVYDLEELLLVIRKEVIYLNWSYWKSFAINAVIMTTLSWFSIVVLKRGVPKQ